MRTRECSLCGGRMPVERVIDKDVGQSHRSPCGAFCWAGSGSIAPRLLHGAPGPGGKGPRDCPMGCEAIPVPDYMRGAQAAQAARKQD